MQFMKSVYLCVVLSAIYGAIPTFAGSKSVKLIHKDGLGSYLADSREMTLYYFAKDEPGKSKCNMECLNTWPSVTAGTVTASAGLSDKDFGVLERENGNQATFRGYPLYFSCKDTKPGDTNGQGTNNTWHVIDPSMFPPAK